jgi:hypothetical protein
MIKNRLQIENAIALGRKSIRDTIKSSRKKKTVASKAMEGSGGGSGISDDGVSGDEGKYMDEFKFLSGRRLSMPDNIGGDGVQGNKILKEEQRRLKFLSQFTDSPGLGVVGMENSASAIGSSNNNEPLIPGGGGGDKEDDDYLSDDDTDVEM